MGERGQHSPIYKKYQDWESVLDRAFDLYPDYAIDMDEPKRFAIAAYQIDSSVNRFLRGQDSQLDFDNQWSQMQTRISGYNRNLDITPVTPVKMDAQEYIQILDSAMVPLKENMLLYRGISGALAKDLMTIHDKSGGDLIGHTINDKGFLSTSPIEDAATNYARQSRFPISVEIEVPKGTKAIPVPAGGNLFWNGPKSDSEFILERGLTIKITKVEKIGKLLKLSAEINKWVDVVNYLKIA
jgi:hypothetical protein